MTIKQEKLFLEVESVMTDNPFVIKVISILPVAALILPDSWLIVFNPDLFQEPPEEILIHECLHYCRGKNTDYDWSDAKIQLKAEKLYESLPQDKKKKLDFYFSFLAGEDAAHQILKED